MPAPRKLEKRERAQEGRRCLVAVDGSAAGFQPLVWALRHAIVHDMTVEVMTVWPSHGSALVHEVPGHFCAPRWSARDAQRDVVRRALEQVPTGSVIATRLENGHVVETIVRASDRCDLVVLGATPNQGPQNLSTHIARQAHCPVALVDACGEVFMTSGRRAVRGTGSPLPVR